MKINFNYAPFASLLRQNKFKFLFSFALDLRQKPLSDPTKISCFALWSEQSRIFFCSYFASKTRQNSEVVFCGYDDLLGRLMQVGLAILRSQDQGKTAVVI